MPCMITHTSDSSPLIYLGLFLFSERFGGSFLSLLGIKGSQSSVVGLCDMSQGLLTLLPRFCLIISSLHSLCTAATESEISGTRTFTLQSVIDAQLVHYLFPLLFLPPCPRYPKCPKCPCFKSPVFGNVHWYWLQDGTQNHLAR